MWIESCRNNFWLDGHGPITEKYTRNEFVRWAKELSCLQEIEVPRNVRGNFYLNENSSEQLHVFCDASKIAHATVAFLRVESSMGTSVELVQSKARVAAIHEMTIPRIELMARTIGARMVGSIITSLGREIECFYWTDSTIAIAWIQRNDEWGTFVGNRVKEIVQLDSPKRWRHVPGKMNPADMPSRGCSPRQLLQSIWWEGPEWLKRSSNL